MEDGVSGEMRMSSIKNNECRLDDVPIKSPKESSAVQEELSRFYHDLVSEWQKELPALDGLSAPLLPFPPEIYFKNRRRLLVVGKETNGWISNWSAIRSKEPRELVSQLTSDYAKFYQKPDYRTPFFNALDALAREYVPGGFPRNHCLWANTVPFDQNREMVSKLAGDALGLATPLLPTLIRITRPTAVVFLSGHNYDSFLQHQFVGLKIVPQGNDGRLLSRLEHPELPKASFRTYHPAYLLRSGKISVLNSISKLIQTS
jgi:hypothetical protein